MSSFDGMGELGGRLDFGLQSSVSLAGDGGLVTRVALARRREGLKCVCEGGYVRC